MHRTSLRMIVRVSRSLYGRHATANRSPISSGGRGVDTRASSVDFAPVSHVGLSLSCVRNFSNYGYYIGYYIGSRAPLMGKLSLTDSDAL